MKKVSNNDQIFEKIKEKIAEIDALLSPLINVNIEGEEERKRFFAEIEALRKAEEIVPFLRIIIRYYQDVGEERRRFLNRYFAKYSNFSWVAYFSSTEDSFDSLFDDILLLSIHDQVDTRDLILALDAWYGKAHVQNIDIASILKTIIPLSNPSNHYGFGSMQNLLERLYERASEKS